MTNYSDPTLTVPSAAAILPSRITAGQILVLVAGIAALGIGGYMYWQIISLNARATADAAENASVKSQIGAVQPSIAMLASYNAVGTGLKQLFDTQRLWSPTLANVEQHLYRHMAVTNLLLDSKGLVTLSGTTPNYTNYAQIYSSLTDPSVAAYFTGVKPVSVAKDAKTGIVSFSFTFTLAPSQLVSASAQ